MRTINRVTEPVSRQGQAVGAFLGRGLALVLASVAMLLSGGCTESSQSEPDSSAVTGPPLAEASDPEIVEVNLVNLSLADDSALRKLPGAISGDADTGWQQADGFADITEHARQYLAGEAGYDATRIELVDVWRHDTGRLAVRFTVDDGDEQIGVTVLFAGS